MNVATSTLPTSHFTQQIIVLKYILNKEIGDITGALILNNRILKRRTYNDSEVIREFRTEEERIAALRDHFEIFLTSKEVEGIEGLITEIIWCKIVILGILICCLYDIHHLLFIKLFAQSDLNES